MLYQTLFEMKNADLYAYHIEINSLQSSVLYVLLKSRIEDFYKKYSIKINTIVQSVRDLHKKYFEVDENGQIVNTEATPESPSKPKLLEGMTMEDYDKEYDELMNQPVTGTLQLFKAN